MFIVSSANSIFTDRSDDRIARKYLGDDLPPISEITVRQTAALFVNQHYSLSGAKPLPAAVVELGGVHIAPAKPLDAELQRYLDESEHGVIYVSWGSMIRASTLPAEKRDGLLKAFGKFKQNVIWKWENETLPNQPSNVLIRKWLPQRDILCHPKVRVFVTHAGLMGSTEATYCGVPTVLTPMYGDQFLNAAAFSSRGMGRIVPYEEISEESVTEALRFALDPSTQEAARKVRYSFRNRQNTPQQTAVWWAEHIAATGGEPLAKSHAVFMDAIAYHGLDVFAFLAVVVLTVLASWLWTIRALIAWRYGSASAKASTKQKVN